MPLRSYHVLLTISPDHRSEVTPSINDLFDLWRKQADDCEWTTGGSCEMIFRYNKDNGDFVFESGGERDIPLHMIDETVAILRDVGRHATCPTVVRVTSDGKQMDFAVGTAEKQKEAAFMAKLENAVEALQEIKDDLDTEFAKTVENTQVALQALLTCKTE
ncbi:MAG: hypothetical protein V3573_13310 [Desulfovibrionaceae bacterium]